MHLDAGTLSLATVFVMALLGALLAVAGLQNRTERALIVWAGGYVGAAAGIGLVMARGSVPDWLSIEFANALTLVSIGLLAVGIRQFDRRPPRLMLAFALAALWLAACMVPAFRADINLRVMLMAVLGALPAIDGALDRLARPWRGADVARADGVGAARLCRHLRSRVFRSRSRRRSRICASC